MLALALATLVWVLWQRLALLRAAAPSPRWDHLGERLRRLLVIGFGQSRQPRYRVAGIVHILIFGGFLVLSLRSMTLIGEAFSAGYADLGSGYAAVKDWTGVVVLGACAVAAWRRVVVRPARYHDRHARSSHTPEALLILALICSLMLADAAYEGSALVLEGKGGGWRMPLASLLAWVFGAVQQTGGAEQPLLGGIHLAAFWIHNAVLLFFLCLLPLGKHFHVLSALPNVFFSKLEPSGKLKPPSHLEADFDALEVVGVSKLEDLGWKELLDVYSCTDCGRCSDHCPAYAAGTALSPRMLSIKMREAAYAHYPLRGKVVPPEQRPALVGETIGTAELWACTTCGACEEACPVMIEYVDKVVDMRRHLVDDGRLPASLQKPLAALEKRGNPYGKMARKRGDWVDGLAAEASANGNRAVGSDRSEGGDPAPCGKGVRILAPGDTAEVLYFTDSCAAFDPRIQRTAVAFAEILLHCGADVGTLGKDEVDSGHEARRFGEEGLFLALREQNLLAMEQRKFSRIVTSDPHALNALRHDYGVELPVLHHSQWIAESVASGELNMQGIDDGRTYTYHDPCYLGRHNGEYQAPRQILAAIPGLRSVEMERCAGRSFCCGGGSLSLFNEPECERRMGEIRLDMAAAAGAQVVVTACPFCLINLEDAIKTSGRDEHMEVVDLAELVAQSLAPQSAAMESESA